MSGAAEKTVHRPELEAVLRVEGREIAVVAFFKDAYGGYDVLVGLENFDHRLLVSTAFGNCKEAVEESEIIELPSNETDPFHRNGR